MDDRNFLIIFDVQPKAITILILKNVTTNNYNEAKYKTAPMIRKLLRPLFRGGKVMKGFIQSVNQGDDLRSIIEGIEVGLTEQMVSGLVGSARSLLIASIYEKRKSKGLFLKHPLLLSSLLYI